LGRRLQSWRTVPIRVASGERHIATPSRALHAVGLEWLRDIAGRKVAVLGSGDNQVAFALAGMGVAVTSVDISEQQIEVARSHAAAFGLRIEFIQADGRPVRPGRRDIRCGLYRGTRRGVGFRPAPVLRRSGAHLEIGRPGVRGMGRRTDDRPTGIASSGRPAERSPG